MSEVPPPAKTSDDATKIVEPPQELPSKQRARGNF
jgi:hypothetical protein